MVRIAAGVVKRILGLSPLPPAGGTAACGQVVALKSARIATEASARGYVFGEECTR